MHMHTHTHTHTHITYIYVCTVCITCTVCIQYVLRVVSVAKNMARSVLDAFAVDREDVFVISETDPQDKEIEDIFYMR